MRVYSSYVQEALKLTGQLIRLQRKQKRWSEQALAERAGVARGTVQRVERGEATCEIGIVFELAALVGVTLFNSDGPKLAERSMHTHEKLALLPMRIREPKPERVDDDF